jgi:hypothetical protein
MIEIFRNSCSVKVGHYQSVLEEQGIATVVKDDNLTIPPTPDSALCVMQQKDLEKAMIILKKHIEQEQFVSEDKSEQKDIKCPQCDKPNPINFETCWSCRSDLFSE